MSLKNTNLKIDFSGGESAVFGLATVQAPLNATYENKYVDGSSGAGKGNKNISLSGATVVNGAAVTHDLTAMTGGLFGVAVNFSGIACIIVKNSASSGGNLLIGAAASNQFAYFVGDAASDKIVVAPGETMVILNRTTPAVVDGTHKSLKVDSSAATCTYDLIIIGIGT